MKSIPTGFHLQDFLLLIAFKARTGELVLESGNNLGSILFYEGHIVHAFSPYSRAIGDLLVEVGTITEKELLETLQLQKKSPVYYPIGGLLLKTGKIKLSVIETMVHEQIRLALKEFTKWQNVQINFSDKDIKPHDQIRLPVHEFIAAATMKSAQVFFSMAPSTLLLPPR